MTSHPGPAGRRPTSADVALAAGVSRATVSHVLNGQVAKFAPQTVARVRRAASELGYVPSAAGRALALGRSDFVVLAVMHLGGRDIEATLQPVSDHLAGLGFMSVVHFRLSDAERVSSPRLHHLVATLRPAGVVDLGGLSRQDLELLEGSGCAVVPSPSRPETSGNYVIARMQAEHLASRGYDRVACAFPPDVHDDPYGTVRTAGAAAGCARSGLPEPAVVEVPAEPAGVQEVVRRLAGSGERVGIAAYDETMADALAAATEAAGIEVPRSLGIVGAHRRVAGDPAVPAVSYVAYEMSAALHYIGATLAAAYDQAPDPAAGAAFDGFGIVAGRST